MPCCSKLLSLLVGLLRDIEMKSWRSAFFLRGQIFSFVGTISPVGLFSLLHFFSSTGFDGLFRHDFSIEHDLV